MPLNLWHDEEYRALPGLEALVFPSDVLRRDRAVVILFVAGPRTSKTTVSALTVDGGNPTAYVR